MRAAGLRLAHLDTTIVAQEPRLAGFLAGMQAAIAALLGAGVERVNVKVTSPDGLGAIGRGEGIAAHAVVLLEGGA
jgi:2-C-methyl-D-erythritol 2,4-cyclodiphosphate synthase